MLQPTYRPFDQFYYDNMLTDEDFYLDTGNTLEVILEEKSLTPLLRDGSNNFNLNEKTTVQQGMKVPYTLHDFQYQDSSTESNGEMLFHSSESVDQSPSETNISVTIPEDSKNNLNYVLSDTPPHTPPGFSENSMPNNTQLNSPYVVSLNSVPVPMNTITYVVPPAQQQVMQSAGTPMKVCVNIQPKPELLNGQVIVPSLKSNSDQDSADSDQLVKLPKGIFQVKSPKPGRPPKNPDILKNGNINNGTALTRCDLIEVCTAAVKRRERIIKNRESAYQSRKRKKEYVKKMEDELNQMSTENSTLRLENHRLQMKVTVLEKEVTSLKAMLAPKSFKKTISLMAVVLFVTFNIPSYGSIFENFNSKPMKLEVENHHIGRSLLWNEINDTAERNTSEIDLHKHFFKREKDSSFIVSWPNVFNSSTCHQYINKTESLRLENDLLGWVKRVEKKQNQKNQKQTKFQKRTGFLKESILPLPKLQLGSRIRGEMHRDIWAKRKSQNEILIYQTARKDYEEFFDAIHRRDDSFYFISFSGDHLLLPAISHNQTHRPKMSFVMPAMILNDSVGESDYHISMMQIDCEVMDTKLLSIKESIVPIHLRQKHSNSSKSNSRSDTMHTLNRNSNRFHGHSIKLPHRSETND